MPPNPKQGSCRLRRRKRSMWPTTDASIQKKETTKYTKCTKARKGLIKDEREHLRRCRVSANDRSTQGKPRKGARGSTSRPSTATAPERNPTPPRPSGLELRAGQSRGGSGLKGRMADGCFHPLLFWTNGIASSFDCLP